jgi:hypothetical protein
MPCADYALGHRTSYQKSGLAKQVRFLMAAAAILMTPIL